VHAAVAAVAVVELHQVGRAGAVAAADVDRVGQLAAGNERLAQRRLGRAVRLQDAVDGALWKGALRRTRGESKHTKRLALGALSLTCNKSCQRMFPQDKTMC
jgi:hypothetical protein